MGIRRSHAHHDAQWLTDGLLYVAATDYIDGRYTDIVKRVDLKGNVLWEYNCAEHLYEIEFPVHEGMPDNHWPMINGVTMRGGVVYMSLRNTSGLIGVDYETKEIVFQKKWPDVAQQHCPYITDQGTILTFCNGNIRPREYTQ